MKIIFTLAADSASVYGNEGEIGEVLKEYIAKGLIKREDLFITTKLSKSVCQ